MGCLALGQIVLLVARLVWPNIRTATGLFTVGQVHVASGKVSLNRGTRTAVAAGKAMNNAYRHFSARSRRTAALCGFFALSHTFDRPLR
jgi:hypothetical protein